MDRDAGKAGAIPANMNGGRSSRSSADTLGNY
jgi:hypothetical protein